MPRGRFVLVLVVVLGIGAPEGGDYDHEDDDEEDERSGRLGPSLNGTFRALEQSGQLR
jgi:hypothetical protein